MSNIPERANVVVIGAGIVGNSLVGHLADQGRTDLVLVGDLLGTHEPRRAQDVTRSGEAVVSRRPESQRDPEIRDRRLAVLEEDVAGLDVAVDHASPMRVVEGLGHPRRDAHRVLDGKLALALHSLAEGLPLHEGHDEVE